MIIKTQQDLRGAIAKVIAYNWSDEEDDYKQQEGRARSQHIFHVLKALDAWLGPHEKD